jgi:hypothetical protein
MAAAGSAQALSNSRAPAVRGRVPQLRHRLILELSDPVAAHLELLAHLFERSAIAPAVKSEPKDDNKSFILVENGEQLVDLLGQHGVDGRLHGVLGSTVGDHLAASEAVAVRGGELLVEGLRLVPESQGVA